MLNKMVPLITALAAIHAQAQLWNETFEEGAKTSYEEGDAACVMGSWRLADALIGSTSGDRYFGAQGVRLRSGRLEMNFDKTNGVETFSAYFAKFGTEGNSSVTVECSGDGGLSWAPVGEAVAVTSAALTCVELPVHAAGRVRFRIINQSSKRVNIDNVMLSDFSSAVPPLIAPLAAQRARVGQALSFALTITPTDGDPVTATNVTASSGVKGAWSLANGVFSYTPEAADIGQRLFSFTASDKDGTGAPVEAAVTVRNPQTAAVRISSANGAYTQTFDALGTNGSANVWDNAADPLPAWYAFENTTAAETYRTGNGSSTSGGLYAFGAAGSANRSLGSLAASDITYRYGVAFTNETDASITNLAVSFAAVQWRAANGATNTLAFEYCVTNRVLPLCQGVWTAVPGLSFPSPAVTNASQAAEAVFIKEARRAALAVSIPAAQVLILRWRDPDDAGADHAFGIDDLAVTWAASARPRGTLVAVR